MEFLCLYLIFVTVSASVSVTINDDQCGVSDYHTSQLETSMIINSAEVPQGKYPWLVNLHVEKLGPGSFCTATIVSKKWILTAAHCIQAEPMTVSVGSVDNQKGKVINVKRHIMHESYNRKGPNDIALIELSEELTYSKDVRRICLTRKRQEADPNINVVIAGWGWINVNNKNPRVLHEGTARVVADDICISLYGSSYDSKGMICVASYKQTMPNRGDSGGPAFVNLEGRWTQIGVADYVYDASLDLTKASGYARASFFCDWIAGKTSNEVQCGK